MHWVDVIFRGSSVRMEFFEVDDQKDVIGVLEAAFLTTIRHTTTFKAPDHNVVLNLSEAMGYAYST